MNLQLKLLVSESPGIVPATGIAMRIGWFQYLAVFGVLAVFAVVLPTHHHAPAAAEASHGDAAAHGAADQSRQAPASDEAPAPANRHSGHGCPICRAAAELGTVVLPVAPLLAQPAPQFAPPINQARPASVAKLYPFDGRAPPAC